MKKAVLILVVALGALVLAQAVQKAYKLVINGKATSAQAIVVSGTITMSRWML